jgi:hypothetical protein
MASYRDGESRIIRGLTQAGLVERAGLGLVSGESARPDAYAGAGRPVPAYTEEARLDDILGEEGRLIARAKADGFFWDKDTVAEVIRGLVSGGGSEHDVYVAGEAGCLVVIRSTINDSYGYRMRSPAQYLRRLQNYNAVFPGIQTRLIGVAQNSRGNGVVWTAQPFVEGRAFNDERRLQEALELRGWERLGSDTIYRHKETGVVFHDAHSDNVLYRGNEIYPIDVIVTDVGSLREPAA